MYHGLSAYNRASGIYSLIQRVQTLSSVECCYADRPIGPIGVYCDIEHAESVAYIADRDVWSTVYLDGQREIELSNRSVDADVWYVSGDDDLYSLYCEYSRKADKVRRRRRYAEIAARVYPSAVWVDKSYGDVWVKRARVLARKFGLYIMYVNST